MFSKKVAMLVALLALLALVAACQPAEPQIVKETVVVEKVVEKEVEVEVEKEVEVVVTEIVEVEKEVQVEVEVEKEVEVEVVVTEIVEVEKEVEVEVEKEVLVNVQGAIPYPEGVPLGTGGEAKKFALDEMIAYKALDAYSQPEWMDALVADGTLPPVEERLPAEPQVFLESGMSAGLGEYGGVWRDFSAVPTEGWNLCAGQTQGWFGINYIYSESLVKSGPMFLRSDKVEPLPNLAKDWEWSDDGTELTMNLIEGAKWSDGDGFDSEDVMFTWEDIILDTNVNSWSSRTTWQIDEQDVELEAVDEYSIKFTFPTAFPTQMLFNMDFLDFTVCPAHQLKPLHPTHNTDADYETFLSGLAPDDLPAVTLGPWVPVEYKTDEFMVLRRNPYYWKVDENGKQLPYLNEVTFQKGETGLGRTLGTLAGSIDHTNLENPSAFVEATKRLQDADAHFYIEWGPETLSFPLELNLSANLGVNDERDTALRELFRDLRFRRALSHAIDRNGVSQAVIRGPFLRPFPGGLAPGSLYFDRSSVAYYPYAPDATATLLADIGFEDTDGNGIMNWTSGELEGEDLVLSVITAEDQAAAGQIAEALVALFGDVGIQLTHRPVKSTVRQDAVENGEWELMVNRSGQEFTVPFTRCDDLAPLTKETPAWHREGAEPRELQPFEEELIAIVTEFCAEADSEKRRELMAEYNTVFTENVYEIGTVIGRYGLALAKRFNNVPAGSPPFFYQWTWGNVQPDQVWVAPDGQLPETLPNTIPVYNSGG
ncbi:MAG: ABC transporter substrate-binding protein [Ardenticatenaceae bacterium]